MLKTSKNGIKHRSAKIVAITVLTVVLLMGTTFYSTTKAKAQIDWGDIGVVVASAGIGAGIGTGIADGPGAVVGAAVGALAGSLYLYLEGGEQNAAISSNAQEAFANQLMVNIQNEINITKSNTINMMQLYNTTEYYFVRKGEWAAYQLYTEQKNSGENYIYDGDYVLETSSVSRGTLAYTYGIIAGYQTILNSYTNTGNWFHGNYDGMRIAIDIRHSTEPREASTDKDHYYKIDYSFLLDNKRYYHFGSHNLTLISTSKGTKVISFIDENGNEAPFWIEGHKYYHLEKYMSAKEILEVNVIGVGVQRSLLTKCLKTNMTGDMLILGYGAPAISNGGHLYPTAITYELNRQTKNISIKAIGTHSPYDNTYGTILIHDDGSGTESHSLDVFAMRFYYKDKQGNTVNKDIALKFTLHDMGMLIADMNDTITTVNNYAYATYRAYVNGQLNDVPAFPDIIFPDPQQLDDMNATDAYAVLITYLRALYEEMQNHTELDYHNVNISKQSFENLRVIGTVERNGTYIIGTNTTDAVFIPYISIQDMNLTLGNNTMQQNGFALVLKNSWNKNTTAGMTMDQIRYVPLLLNDTIHIDAIEINGQPRSYVNLNVTKLKFVVPQLSSPAAPPQFEQLAQAMVGWMKQHILTTSFLAAGIGALIFMPAPSNKTWGFILLAGAVAMYFFVEPAIASFTANPLGALGLSYYWRW